MDQEILKKFFGDGIVKHKNICCKLWKENQEYPKKGIKKLMEHFVADTTARTAAELVEINRNTATKYYRKWREIIAANIKVQY